jgi:hypothetical protein
MSPFRSVSSTTGAVSGWGGNWAGLDNGSVSSSGSGLTGDAHTCALMTSGAAKCWGRFGTLGNDGGGATQGAVWYWGDNRFGQLARPVGSASALARPLIST